MSYKASWPKWNNQPINLYHGTVQRSAARIVAEGIDVSTGRAELDFGQGFYTTTSLRQAQHWANIKGSYRGYAASVVQLSLSRLELRKLRSLVFILGDAHSSDYWSFIQHCRRGHKAFPQTSEDYDVVYGPVAFRWGPDEYQVKSGLDQISFHGPHAQELLRNSGLCTLEVLK